MISANLQISLLACVEIIQGGDVQLVDYPSKRPAGAMLAQLTKPTKSSGASC